MQGTPRFASQDWLSQLAHVNANRKMRLAAHLCSGYVTQVLQGDPSFVAQLRERYGFHRVQVNATAANNVDTRILDEASAGRLREVMNAVPAVEFILQRNEETRPLWMHFESDPPANLSFLYDESKGRGIASETWPSLKEVGVPYGYAGGLGPKNLTQQLASMAAVAGDAPIWVDMESSLRTRLEGGGDIFDINKVMDCALQVVRLGLAPAQKS
mmetsp:Transcript_52390/g.71527  ORF Transcript_52390/g.71527 Transcript_52390/m.71527 type:complete len:214 (-) Transcript_52390:355-996(-)